MKTMILASAVMLALAPTAAGAQPAAQASAAQARSWEQVTPEIDRLFRAFHTDQPTPGLIYGIVRDGGLAHHGTFGVQDLEQRRPVTASTRFRIASMSKAFTALAILKLRDDGRLRLDDLAEQHVPELRGLTYPTSDSPRIRVRDLLTHVGGFVTDDPWGDRQQVLTPAEFTALLRQNVPFTRPPQTAFEYSNLGYALLGRIITNASGRPYQRYIREEIMAPLRMGDTTYDVTAVAPELLAVGYRRENDAWSREPTLVDGEFGAMGGVVTTADDYAKWLAFLLSAWPARDGAETGPVRRATVREMAQGLNFVRLASRPVAGQTEPCRTPSAYAMGLIVAQSCGLGTSLMHGGGYPGYGSYVMLYPERGLAIFGFTNRTYTAPVVPMWGASDLIRDAGLAPERVQPVSPALAAAYRAAGAMVQAGRVDGVRASLAMNFLLDRSAENWARELASLRGQVGGCRTDAPIAPTGGQSGVFEWVCERGRLQGVLLLAPTNTPQIQALRLRVAPAR